MSSNVHRRLCPFVVFVILAAGCATKEKQRIGMLEQANQNLTDRLNATRGELDSATRDREALDRRLQTALSQIDSLKNQLAERPAMEPAAPGWTAVPGGAMIAIEGRVLFAPGKNTLRPEARRTLDAVQSAIQGEYADKDVLVFGHTDNQPIKKSGWKDNYELSTERALAVVRYLEEHGVSAKRLIACGCGEHRPVVPNSSAANRAANRRVEIYAMDPSLYRGRS